MDNNNKVERVDSTQYGVVAKILTSSFINDPILTWYVRKDKKRESVIEDHFQVALNKYFLSSIVYKDTLSLGSSVWIDSKEIPAGLSLGMKLQFLYSVYKWTTLSGIPRYFNMMKIAEENHPTEPHHYLYVIGVRPEAQGKGIGSKMMRYHLNILDDLGMPAYLENSNKKNSEFYRRYGFEQVNEMKLDKDGPYLWGMWREPHAH